ncbi:substrate-binding domain-containing protein [Thalassolituus sp. LLYu03]|uniref:substrate-binding domain-containing protein n=1 Tax=Thalassolituus sp. LLYu03 TaxID=3421656 RepID=UPI003D26E00D
MTPSRRPTLLSLPTLLSSALSSVRGSALKTVLISGLLFSVPSWGHGDVYAVIAKSSTDINFLAVQEGCQQEAAKHKDSCELLGPEGSANPRVQYQVLNNAVNDRRYAAIGLSVTRGDVLAKAAANATVPIITFDSPFPAAMKHLAQAYVGPDNEDIGRVLGKLVTEYHPKGGQLCIMTAAADTNLDNRVLGLRRQLSGNPDLVMGQRLRGENGWSESLRCPWENSDDPERTMGQLKTTLQDTSATVFVSVGSWPIVSPDDFRNLVSPYYDQLNERSLIITTGVTTPEQRMLVNDGLVRAFVRIDFNGMGRQLYQLMRTARENPANVHDLIAPVNIIRPL